MRSVRSCSALALLAFTALGCSDREPVLAPGAVRGGFEGGSALVVEADLSIARLVLSIDGRTMELRREEKEGLLSGALDVMPGSRASLTFRAYDAEGLLTHEGKGSLDVGKAVTPQREFVLRAVPGADVAAVRIGTYRLVLTPSVIDGAPGRESVIRAELLDARGVRHPLEEGSVQWMPTKDVPEIGDIHYDYHDYILDIRWPLEKPIRARFCADLLACGRFERLDAPAPTPSASFWRSPGLPCPATGQRACCI